MQVLIASLRPLVRNDDGMDDDAQKDRLRVLAYLMHDTFNARDVDGLDDVLHERFHSHPLKGGLDAVKASRQKIAETYPEARTVIEDVLVDGDRVAIRSTTYGVGTPADEPSAQMLEIARVEDGKFIELWGLSARSTL